MTDASNVVSGELTRERAAELLQKIREVRGALLFLIALTKGQRQRLAKPGDRQVAAARAMAQLAAKHPALFPKELVDPAEMLRDAELDQSLRELATEAVSLALALRDTRLGARSDLYRNGLKAYTIAGLLGDKVPGIAAEIAPMREVLDRSARGPEDDDDEDEGKDLEGEK